MGGTGGGSLPDIYKLRVMPNRSGVAQRQGQRRKAKRPCKLPCTGWPIIRPTMAAGIPMSTARAGNWWSKDAIAKTPEAKPTRALPAWPCWPFWPADNASNRPIRRKHPARTGISAPHPSRGRQLGRKWAGLRIHVLPCHGRLRLKRSIRNDARPTLGKTRAPGDRFYRRRPGFAQAAAGAIGPAIRATPAKWAGNYGTENRGTGGHSHACDHPQRNRPIPPKRILGPTRRLASYRPASASVR